MSRMSRKPQADIVGYGEDGTIVRDGKFIFWMMDSQGIPLEVLMLCLRKRKEAFDVAGFIEEALSNPNYQTPDAPQRLKQKLLNARRWSNPKERKEVEMLIDACIERFQEQVAGS
jgi:hypothetical protein